MDWLDHCLKKVLVQCKETHHVQQLQYMEQQEGSIFLTLSYPLALDIGDK
jgi:hypothetical protein